ncbi:MAG: energy-coupling factor ABC transporter ATP-binding protein [Succiniclasticum sp.]|jgi:energy-coupling factor transport system ATP-binding protein
MTDSVVSFDHYYFQYTNARSVVLKNICLDIERGSFTVLVGPSGAGKTTLCKSMTGILPYYQGGSYAGDVRVLGKSTKGQKVSDLAMSIGFMMEDYESQLVSLTAGEEVAFALVNHGFPPEETDERVRRALAEVGLPERENYQLDELSGGQRQRLALASLLAVRPEIIVLDEPVSAMDPDGAESLYQLIHQIHQDHGTTFVIVEHRVEFVLPYVTNLVAVKEGRITAAGSCEDVVPALYADPDMRPLLPDLWQIHGGLEARTGQQFRLWRSVGEAVDDLQERGMGPLLMGRREDRD